MSVVPAQAAGLAWGACTAEPWGGLRCLACCRIRPSGSVPPWEIGFHEDALALNNCQIDRLASRLKPSSGLPCSCLVLSKPVPADFHRGSDHHRGAIPVQPPRWLGKQSQPNAAFCSGASAATGVALGQGCIWDVAVEMRAWVGFIDPKSCRCLPAA